MECVLWERVAAVCLRLRVAHGGCCALGCPAYSLDDSDGFTRHDFNAVVSPYDLQCTYTPAFKASVLAGAKGVMCSCECCCHTVAVQPGGFVLFLTRHLVFLMT